MKKRLFRSLFPTMRCGHVGKKALVMYMYVNTFRLHEGADDKILL
jgi:hypothetical protein